MSNIEFWVGDRKIYVVICTILYVNSYNIRINYVLSYL